MDAHCIIVAALCKRSDLTRIRVIAYIIDKYTDRIAVSFRAALTGAVFRYGIALCTVYRSQKVSFHIQFRKNSLSVRDDFRSFLHPGGFNSYNIYLLLTHHIQIFSVCLDNISFSYTFLTDIRIRIVPVTFSLHCHIRSRRGRGSRFFHNRPGIFRIPFKFL